MISYEIRCYMQLNRLKNYLRQSLFAILITFSFINCGFAQPVKNDDLGEAYFLKANDAYKKKEYSKVLGLLEEAASHNNVKALYTLGIAYSTTTEYSHHPDTDAAFNYMLHAAELGDQRAKKQLINFKLKGYGSTSDDEIKQLRVEAKEKLSTKLSNQERMETLFGLVESYLYVKQKNLRNVKEAETYEKQLLLLPLSAFENEVHGMICMSISIFNMFGLYGSSKDPAVAFQWMKTAASLNLKEAYYNLSDMYFYGYGTPVSFSKSKEMTQQGEKLNWSKFGDHKKHLFPFTARPVIYLFSARYNWGAAKRSPS